MSRARQARAQGCHRLLTRAVLWQEHVPAESSADMLFAARRRFFCSHMFPPVFTWPEVCAQPRVGRRPFFLRKLLATLAAAADSLEPRAAAAGAWAICAGGLLTEEPPALEVPSIPKRLYFDPAA